MKESQHFVVAVLGAAFAAFLLFGGLGLMAVGAGAYFWQLAPYRRGAHAEHSETHYQYFLIQQDVTQTLPGPKRPGRYFLQLLLCLALVVIGLLRLDNPGLVGLIG